MEDLTKKYRDLKEERDAQERRGEEKILSRINEHLSRNTHFSGGEKNPAKRIKALWAIRNYLEVRTCRYSRRGTCASCGGRCVLWGLNCKGCGKWLCVPCAEILYGAGLCASCAGILQKRRNSRAGAAPDEILGHMEVLWEGYRLIQRSRGRPCPADCSTLREYLGGPLATAPQNGGDALLREALQAIGKNVREGIRKRIERSYIRKYKEDFSSVLVNQMVYLGKIIGEYDGETRREIERAIEAVQWELSSVNEW